jgi:hypothetical protein
MYSLTQIEPPLAAYLVPAGVVTAILLTTIAIITGVVVTKKKARTKEQDHTYEVVKERIYLHAHSPKGHQTSK